MLVLGLQHIFKAGFKFQGALNKLPPLSPLPRGWGRAGDRVG